MGIEKQSNRAVVGQRNIHHGLELTGLNGYSMSADSGRKLCIEAFGKFGPSGLGPGRSAPFSTIIVQGKLGYDKETAAGIEQRQVYISAGQVDWAGR